MTATEVKAKLLALLDEVEAGGEVAITRRGRLVGRLVPAKTARSLRGVFAGVAMSVSSEEELFRTGATWELE